MNPTKEQFMTEITNRLARLRKQKKAIAKPSVSAPETTSKKARIKASTEAIVPTEASEKITMKPICIKSPEAKVSKRNVPEPMICPKWMTYSSELILGNSIEYIEEKYNDTRKNILDIMHHSVRDNAPKIYQRLRRTKAW